MNSRDTDETSLPKTTSLWEKDNQYMGGRIIRTAILDNQFKDRLFQDWGSKVENRLFIYKMHFGDNHIKGKDEKIE